MRSNAKRWKTKSLAKLVTSWIVCRSRERTPRLGTTRRSAGRLSRRPTRSPRRTHLHLVRPVRSGDRGRQGLVLPLKASRQLGLRHRGPVANLLPDLVLSPQQGGVYLRQVHLQQVQVSRAQVADPALPVLTPRDPVALGKLQKTPSRMALGNLAPVTPVQDSPALDSQGKTLLVLASSRLTPRKV